MNIPELLISQFSILDSRSSTLDSCVLNSNVLTFVTRESSFEDRVETVNLPLSSTVICDLKTNGKYLTLANVYAPNEDDANFFHSFFGHLLDFNCEDIIIGVDFNLVLHTIKEKRTALPERTKIL